MKKITNLCERKIDFLRLGIVKKSIHKRKNEYQKQSIPNHQGEGRKILFTRQ